MALMQHDIESLLENQDGWFEKMLQDHLRQAVRLALMTVLEEEVTAIIGQDPMNEANIAAINATGGKISDLAVPRTRKGHQTHLLERYHPCWEELDTAMGEMFVKGVSQEKVGQVIETLTGSHPSPSTVPRVFHTLEGEYEQWKQRPLQECYVYVFVDGTYFTVIYNEEGWKMPILAAYGIAPPGEREVLAFPVGDRENQMAWEQLLDNLKRRGVQQIDLFISDGN